MLNTSWISMEKYGKIFLEAGKSMVGQGNGRKVDNSIIYKGDTFLQIFIARKMLVLKMCKII